MNWVSSRLYPLVKAACPHHPLLRETRREVLHDLLDVPAALRWLDSAAGRQASASCPSLSPFAAAWITPIGGRAAPVRIARRGPASAPRAADRSGRTEVVA